MSDSSGAIATQNTTSGLTDLTLAVRIDGAPDQEVFLQHGLSIGRNPSNTICIADPQIERIHAMVCRQADGTMLLECTAEHLRLKLADGTETHALPLKPGTTFKLGSAVIRCLKRETKPTVVVAENPWEVRCPRCHGVIADLKHSAKECPHCQLEIQYFAPAPQPQGQQVDEALRPPEFSGWLPRDIGPYKIRAFVAQGGMGIILRGLHKELDMPAAVKLLKVDSDEDPTWRQRFLAEIDTLKSLKHPNVVRLQDYGKEDKLLWLAMDWIDGQSLGKIANKHRAGSGNVPIEAIRQILPQVVTGLKYLHEKQIIHRDLKPSNILMAQDDLVKMVDFGIARGASGQTAVVTQLTQTGVVAGTESYMSPEQAEGHNITPASDIYSLGVMWYELVVGRRPVGAFAAPHLLRSDCPISWSNTIAQCLAVDPRARPTLDRINQVLTGTGAEPPPLPSQRVRAPGQPGAPVGPTPASGVIQSPPTAQTSWTPPPPRQGGGSPPPSTAGTSVQQSSAPIPPGPHGPGAPGAYGPARGPYSSQPAGPSTFANATAAAGQVARQTGQAIASASKTAYDATRAFLEKHPPKGWLEKLGPAGQWILGHKGPSIAIAGAVLLILIVLMVRACSGGGSTYSSTSSNNVNQIQGGAQQNAPAQNQPLVNQQNPPAAFGNQQNQPIANQPRPRQTLQQQYEAGLQMMNNARTYSDYQQGFKLVSAAAEGGYTVAMRTLAQIYADPRNQTAGLYNPQLAISWLRRAATAGDAGAIQELRQFGIQP